MDAFVLDETLARTEAGLLIDAPDPDAAAAPRTCIVCSEACAIEQASFDAVTISPSRNKGTLIFDARI